MWICRRNSRNQASWVLSLSCLSIWHWLAPPPHPMNISEMEGACSLPFRYQNYAKGGINIWWKTVNTFKTKLANLRAQLDEFRFLFVLRCCPGCILFNRLAGWTVVGKQDRILAKWQKANEAPPEKIIFWPKGAVSAQNAYFGQITAWKKWF